MSDAIEHLRQLHQQAHEGPWQPTTVKHVEMTDAAAVVVADTILGLAFCDDYVDAALIAAMRNALPHLLDIAEAARDAIYETEDEDGKRWLSFMPSAAPAIHKALARLENQ